MNAMPRPLLVAMLWIAALVDQRTLAAEPGGRPARDIRKLSQHFIARDTTAPWTFLPSTNVARVSTRDHAGVVTLVEAGKGQDIKGLLDAPIKIDDYPLPWEFHLGMIQNYQATKGISERQVN